MSRGSGGGDEIDQVEIHAQSISTEDVDDGVKAGFSTHPSVSRISTHQHDHHLLLLVIRGTLHCSTSEATASVARGGCLLVPLGTPHQDHFVSDGNRARVLNILVDPSWTDVHGIDPGAVTRIHHHDSVAPLASRLHHEIRDRRTGWRLTARGYLLSLLAELWRTTRREGGEVSTTTAQLRRLGLERFRDPPTMAELSRRLDTSPSEICRVFKRDTGETFGAYLRRVRADHARRLLVDSSLSLKDIADACGYADQSHFTHQFKAHLGITPGRFRKTAGEGSS